MLTKSNAIDTRLIRQAKLSLCNHYLLGHGRLHPQTVLSTNYNLLHNGLLFVLRVAVRVGLRLKLYLSKSVLVLK